MVRTDSGTGEEFSSLAGATTADHDIKPSNSKHNEVRIKDSKERRSPKRPTPSSMSVRKHSGSSTGNSKTRSSGSRSSSMHSKRRRGDGLRPQRIHTSPTGSVPRASIDDAVAFHERSCRLMEALSMSSRNVEPVRAPLHRATTSPYLVTPPFIHPNAHGPPSPLDQDSTVADTSTEALHIEHPVTHWTSATTRSKQYAKIDKQNSGFRKFIRKLVPCCLSKPTRLDFYDEKDDSDAGSVRRYRIDLPDVEK